MDAPKLGEDIVAYLKRSQSVLIPARITTGPTGQIDITLDAEIPNIARKRKIIPLTNHTFKLEAPKGTKGGFGGTRDYYFKRCGG